MTDGQTERQTENCFSQFSDKSPVQTTVYLLCLYQTQLLRRQHPIPADVPSQVAISRVLPWTVSFYNG